MNTKSRGVYLTCSGACHGCVPDVCKFPLARPHSRRIFGLRNRGEGLGVVDSWKVKLEEAADKRINV